MFRQKVKLLAQLLTESRNCVVCSGKELATYTTTVHKDDTPRKQLTKICKTPTLTHYALVSLYKHGHIQYWVQQYHDGLPQQCGFPQERVNEIHGSKYDPSNPVVDIGGTLRTDLFEGLLQWEGLADMALLIGTTKVGGMSSDRVFRNIARKGKQKLGIGGVIIGLQQTPDDRFAALKIYSKSEHVMEALCRELRIRLDVPCNFGEVDPYQWHVPQECRTSSHDIFMLPYNCKGERNDHKSFGDVNDGYTLLNLEKGSPVTIRAGMYESCQGVVIGKTPQGHYRILLNSKSAGKACQDSAKVSCISSTDFVPLMFYFGSGRTLSYSQSRRSSFDSTDSNESGSNENCGNDADSPHEVILGIWWLESAARGAIPLLPVTNTQN